MRNHVTRDERSKIEVLLSMGVSLRQIAKQLQRSPSTISREIRRNSKSTRYDCCAADTIAKARQYAVRRVPKKMSGELKQSVLAGLREDWSQD
jgi:IS30 family transposase